MKSNIGIVKFGGIAFILSGILFLGVSLFLLPVPSPPLSDTELMNWLKEWKFNISMADELLFFAALMLVPSIARLFIPSMILSFHRISISWFSASIMEACTQ